MGTLPRPYLCALLLGGAVVPAGAVGQDPLPLLDDYHIRVFTVADGLAVSEIRVIGQDDEGYLYAGAGRGMARFDGRSFTVIPLEGFETTLVDRMIRDRTGRMWVTSRGRDLGFLHDGQLRIMPPPPTRLRDPTPTSDGTMWFGSEAGLVRVDPEADEPYEVFTTTDGLPSDRVAGMFELPGGERVVVTARGLARPVASSASRPRFEPFGPVPQTDEWSAAAYVDGSALWILAADGVVRYRDGRLTAHRGPDQRFLALDDLEWTGTVGGLAHWMAYRVDLGATLPDGLPGKAHWILGARDGTRWIVVMEDRARGTKVGLVREREGRFEQVDLRSHLQFRHITRLFEDHEGGIWVGTDRGLIQLSPRRAGSLTLRHGLRDGFTTAVLQTRDRAVWVGSFGGGLHRFANGRVQVWDTTVSGERMEHVRSLLEASDGTVWIGARGGLAAMGEDGPDRVLPGQEVRDILETTGADGLPKLWVSNAVHLMIGRPSGAEERPGGMASRWRFREFHPRFAHGDIWMLHEDTAGAVWVGGTGGLFRIVGDSVRRMEPAGGASAHFVSVHEEADGTLWFGTYEDGLFRYRDGRFARLTTAAGARTLRVVVGE